jgi:hypothetical protein
MGVVYEVHDRVRDEAVALKTLVRTSAAEVYRLKREFRSLADVTHRNLVCLYELFVEEERCFFTMELVRGVSFVDYARATDANTSGDRLAAAFRQLVAGVSALHRRGKLHRDIKPSNVLVTPEGRVVILDFGLIAELTPQVGEIRYVRGGTPAYMSPEEGSGATPSEASDWYGVGVTLYEALTGTPPFTGNVLDVMWRKRTEDPAAPAHVAAHVPADLSSVCMGLLQRLPERRLSGPEALRELDHVTSPPVSEAWPGATRETLFVGRDRQLRALNDAFRTVMNGSALAVSVHGPSGIGKSALVRRFLSDLTRRREIVVLSGRCYENESVPYKALDGVVDDLSRYLGSIPRSEVEALLPSDVPALTRVFPVLLQVHAVANARRDREPESSDSLSLRRRAFEALRELFLRLAHGKPLVVSIDDLQWADADSVVLLEELLQPPRSPAMLTVLCFRSEETAAKPFLEALLDRAGGNAWSAIRLDGMTEDEAFTLIGGLGTQPGGDAANDAGGARQPVRARTVGALRRRQPTRCDRRAHVCDDVRHAALRIVTRCPPLPRNARGVRPADGAGDRLRRVRHRARAADTRRHAALVALHSQQRLLGASRGLSRSDPRSARRADSAQRSARDSQPHGRDAHRAAQRRLRGAVRALPRRG